MTLLICQDPLQHFPAVEIDILLKEVIQQTISGNFKLRSNSQCGTSGFGSSYALNDSCEVTLKIQSPLVERASRYRYQVAHVVRCWE